MLDLLIRGRRAAVTYLAQDAFYYLAVGRNAARLGKLTFDGERLTNGFHPLWQVCVVLIETARARGGWSELANLSLLVVVCAVITAGAMVLLGRVLRAAYGRVSPLFLLFNIGLVGAVVSMFHPRFGTLYALVNGMETPLTLLGYVLTLAAALRLGADHRSGLRLGAALALVALSRLDHILFAAAVLALLFARALLVDRSTLRSLLYAGTVVATVLALDAVLAKVMCGGLVPTSGVAKTSFPHLRLDSVVRLWARPSRDSWGRLAQLFLPLPLAAADLLLRVRRWRTEGHISTWHATLAGGSAFTLVLGAYNIAFVALFNQGTWYYGTVLLHTTIISYDHARPWIDRLDGARFSRAVAWTSGLLPPLWFVFIFHSTDPNSGILAFVEEERDLLLARYAGQNPHIYSVDDGLLSYLTPFPTMSGVGLVLDAEAHARQREGGSLLALAYQRGFDRFASWAYGGSLAGLSPTADESEIIPRLTQVAWFWDEFDAHGLDFVFRVEYASPSRKMYVLRFGPRADVINGRRW